MYEQFSIQLFSFPFKNTYSNGMEAKYFAVKTWQFVKIYPCLWIQVNYENHFYKKLFVMKII